MRKKFFAFFIFTLIFFSLHLLVKAKETQEDQVYNFFQWDPKYIWVEVFGLPEEWLQPRNFLFNFLVPFLALYVILLGIFRQLRIFWRTPGVEVVLAFAISFIFLSTKIFLIYLQITLGLVGVWGYSMFLLMFIVGSFLYSLGYIFKPYAFLQRQRTLATVYKTYRKGTESLEKQLESIRLEIGKVQAEMVQAKPEEDLTPFIKKIEKLRKQEEDIIKKLNALKLTTRV
ncbi:MAG: hypothetical protein NZ942_01710 [Candidatus Aenigmarchaeota archaeon]|nr:hypothetical protein [Candidatus Aenigmarchaeota archaeon]